MLVTDYVDDATAFDWDQQTYNSYFNRIKDAVEIKVPKLSEMACEQVEFLSVPFASFIADRKADGESASNSFVLRGYVRHWLNNVWAEYRPRAADGPDRREELVASAPCDADRRGVVILGARARGDRARAEF